MIKATPANPKSLPASSDIPEQRGLTPRQEEIMRCITDGLTYKDVAKQLFISETTVKYHMNEIRKRLHLKNRTHAVAYFVTSTSANVIYDNN